MTEQKYKMTVFKNRFKTEGSLSEKTFSEIYFGLKLKAKRTREKFLEYKGADKQTQVNIKDVGGFIGGETEGFKRINGIKITRQLLTLDIDANSPDVYEYLVRNIHFYCIVHTTHSHSPEENRFRIIAPLSREVNADEYEAIGRRVAYKIENPNKNESFKGLFDETTFQANRLMFFPSVACDGEYICELLNLDMANDEQQIIDVDKIFEEYNDKNDIYEWFRPQRIDAEKIGRNNLQNKNPLKANGLIGAFNRTYSITQAIEKFLSHIYKKERNGRYTYMNGDSHGGGIILSNDTLFYSHHGTDPANLYYRSAFDLVKIHLFGDFDESFTPEKIIAKGVFEKTESFTKMIEFCRTIPEVLERSDTNIALAQKLEKQDKYVEEFFEKDETFKALETKEEEVIEQEEEKKVDNSWIVQLDGMKSNFAKLDIIFTHDNQIGNLFYYDTFRENICFQKKPYWQPNFVDGTALQDKDMAHIRAHLEKVYGVRGEKVIDDAIVVEADKIQKNKVLEYFDNLVWDKEERLETFFFKFFKVPLNPFTRAAFKHWLVGAVSRIYKSGSPMDLLLIIKGAQGIGKSLFFKRLATLDFKNEGEHLYSDTKIDFNKSKDSYEQLEGIWIYEWKELAGMNMSEQESIKAFVDKTEDKFRRSYGRRNVELKRRVAFGGTTNEKTPLRDRSGNRRFLVMESPLPMYKCYINDPEVFTQEIKDQLLAEAIVLYKGGFNIFEWTKEEYEWWERSNEDNLTENDFLGQIGNFLEMQRPPSWYSMTLYEMQQYMDGYDFQKNRFASDDIWDNDFLVPVDKTCVQEIWKVALRQKDVTINRYHRDLIAQAIDHHGWELVKQQQRFGIFGHQQPFVRKTEKEKNILDDLPF